MNIAYVENMTVHELYTFLQWKVDRGEYVSAETALRFAAMLQEQENEAAQQARDEAFEAGEEAGYAVGFSEGKDEGYEQGFEEGREEGYDDGYQAAKEEDQ